MRTATVMLCSTILSTGMLAGCGDLTSPTTRGLQVERPSFSRSSGVGQTADGYTQVKKNGHIKRYRVKIDKGHRSIDLETVVEEGDYTISSVGSTCDDPTLPGCETNPEDPGGGTGSPWVDEALDVGQTILGDVATESSGECPREMTGGIWFRWRTHDFVIWGTFVRQLSIRSWPWGEAEYALPPGPHESQDNRATIWNGVVKAKCFGYADPGGGFTGIMNWTWLRGSAEEHGLHTGSGTDEISYYNASNGTLTWTPGGHVSTGDSQVDAVINKWLDTGQCTDGWVIVVDGVRVC